MVQIHQYWLVRDPRWWTRGRLHSLLLHNSGFKKRKICFSVRQSLLLIDPLLFTPFVHCYHPPSVSILPTFECRLPTDCCLSSTNCMFAWLLPAFHPPITHLLISTCQSSIVSLRSACRPPVDCLLTTVAWKSMSQYPQVWLHVTATILGQEIEPTGPPVRLNTPRLQDLTNCPTETWHLHPAL